MTYPKIPEIKCSPPSKASGVFLWRVWFCAALVKSGARGLRSNTKNYRRIKFSLNCYEGLAHDS